MSLLSIGIIEVKGLANAIKVADNCVKSAYVNLIGYESSHGSGMMIIKLEGDVSSVTAAIESAGRFNEIYSKKIIPRPSDEIECLIKNNNTTGCEKTIEKQNVEIVEAEDVKIEELETATEEKEFRVKVEEKYTCNLCKDPKCSRRKGELRINCIHYMDKKYKK